MIRVPPPPDVPVVPESTPIVAFGDPTIARIATVGLNPSVREFTTPDGRLLSDASRRLETLTSLSLDARAGDMSAATEEQVSRAWVGMRGYFLGNPYWRWFRYLEDVMAGTGASFAAGSACHIDMAPWATDPTWSSLSPRQAAALGASGAPVLRTLLERGSARALLINGRGVWRALESTTNLRLEPAEEIDASHPPGCSIGVGTGPGSVRLFAWSVNLQSSWGVTTTFRARLAERVAEWWASL